MSKDKEFVFIFIEKPTECRECPCYGASAQYLMDRCNLANKSLVYDWVGDSTIPDWCPLKPIKLTV